MKTKTLLSSPQTLQDLQDFMFDTMCSADMAVDWFCDQFNVSATDEVIDYVVDAHFGMFADQCPRCVYFLCDLRFSFRTLIGHHGAIFAHMMCSFGNS